MTQVLACIDSPSLLETLPKVCAGADSFSVREDGRFVGDDGFVVPASYAEFQDEFPTHVHSFVRRHMKQRSFADKEDRESELNLYLMTLPLESHYRLPDANGRSQGCTDRIQTFHPERAYGASRARFLCFVNFLLMNAFISICKKSQANPIERSNNLIMSVIADGSPCLLAIDDEYLYQIASETPHCDVTVTALTEKIMVQQFVNFVEKHNPELVCVVKALFIAETFFEAQRELGMTEQLFTRARNRLDVLLECFHSNYTVPRQRKVYRTRSQKTVEFVPCEQHEFAFVGA